MSPDYSVSVACDTESILSRLVHHQQRLEQDCLFRLLWPLPLLRPHLLILPSVAFRSCCSSPQLPLNPGPIIQLIDGCEFRAPHFTSDRQTISFLLLSSFLLIFWKSSRLIQALSIIKTKYIIVSISNHETWLILFRSYHRIHTAQYRGLSSIAPARCGLHRDKHTT